MSKPRWIDSGVFRTLRTATRKRNLALFIGPGHGDAALARRSDLKAALGDADPATLSDDSRWRSGSDPGLAAAWRLRQPGFATTAVCDALIASKPDDVPTVRRFGPDSKGLKSAWDRKEPFVVRLAGSPDEPGSLVLGSKARKALTVPDSRYQAFLRATFARTVVFSGYALDDPDLIELLDDVSRVFNGHVPENLALVPADGTDPSTALRASMHYGMQVVEYPADMSPGEALAEVAGWLEELEVPKPPTGNPPAGFTEMTADFRAGVPAADDAVADMFDRGDSSSWITIRAGADAPRTAAAGLQAFLLGEVPEGKVAVALLRGPSGHGKSTLLRRVAWDLAEQGRRVFWREFGASLPDRYVPEERDDAIAVFVADDADQLDGLPALLASLAAQGQGKARFLLAAEADRWERSGLDHRIGLHAHLHAATLDAPDAAECAALARGLAARGHLGDGIDEGEAARLIGATPGHLMDRTAAARGVGSIRSALAARIASLDGHPDADLLRRAYLGVASVHRYGMCLARAHLASLLGVAEDALDARVLDPLGHGLRPSGAGAIRTRHPIVAGCVADLLAGDDAARDAIVIDLLRTLPGGSVADNSVFHQPSELIRCVRQGPLAPLTLGRFFEAGEDAARNDASFWFDRGRFDAEFNRHEPALHHFDQALWRRPGDRVQREHNASVQSHRARCLLALKRRKEALAAVEEGLRLSPQDPSLLRLREKLGGRRPTGRGGDRRGGERGEGRGRGRGGGRKSEGRPGGERRGEPRGGGGDRRGAPPRARPPADRRA